MGLADYFALEVHEQEKQDLPLLRELIERYSQERPLEGMRLVFGHLLVRNSMAVAEALWLSGAEIVFADAFPSPADKPVREDLARCGVEVLLVEEAVKQGDIYVDVSAVLGRARTPRMAAEVTRTGVLHYRSIPCPVVSADDCRAKRIEGFFGTGDGFVRAWRQLRPNDPLEGKRVLQFGYGKIGRGVAQRVRAAGGKVVLAEIDQSRRARAQAEGFACLEGTVNPGLQEALAEAEVIISVTGVPGVLSKTLPPDWLRAGGAVLVSLGAEDEFGEAFEDGEVLGGKAIPLNFHLAQPTLNRYVDAPLAAHVMAVEALAKGDYGVGVYPLPEAMDDWLVRTWREHWPDEDLTGIGEELGLA